MHPQLLSEAQREREYNCLIHIHNPKWLIVLLPANLQKFTVPNYNFSHN